MENFDKSYSPKRSEYRNCESCGGEGCPDCYGFGFSMKNPEPDEATKKEYLNLKRDMKGIENDERDPGHGEMVRTANIRLGELDLEFPGLKNLPELKDLKENKLTTMEKKLITEMKFMMERLESPRMTYTQYEKKRNNLIKEYIDWIGHDENRPEPKHDWEDEWDDDISEHTKDTLKSVTGGGEAKKIYASSSNGQIYVIVEKGGVYHLWTYADTAANAQEFNKTFNDIKLAEKFITDKFQK